MTPYTFHSGDARKMCQDNQSKFLTLRFYGKNIYPSGMLADMLGLHVGAHVAITLDEDKPENVYIRRADDADDDRSTQTAKVCYDCVRKGTLVFSSKAVVDYILGFFHGAASVTLYVSPAPVIINNKVYYRIITNQFHKVTWLKDMTPSGI